MRMMLTACWLPLLAGCLAGGQTYQDSWVPAPLGSPPKGVVFVANGAGDSRSVSRNLAQVVAETCAPLQIQTFDWSRGHSRYIADQVDHENHLAQGRRLALQISAYRAAYPERRTYLMGHSAGCAVVLGAAEWQPPGSVTRIILLAPSTCTTCDLRPALRATRDGIDVFHSEADRYMLGLGVAITGTTEGGCRRAAGRQGFIPIVESPADAALYERLRQHAWSPDVRWSGHDGGHFGNHQPGFLRAYVLPLLLCNH